LVGHWSIDCKFIAAKTSFGGGYGDDQRGVFLMLEYQKSSAAPLTITFNFVATSGIHALE
jgi:hypothetical protein